MSRSQQVRPSSLFYSGGTKRSGEICAGRVGRVRCKWMQKLGDACCVTTAPLCERDITPLLPRLTIVSGRDYAALLVFAGENDGTEPCGPGLREH